MQSAAIIVVAAIGDRGAGVTDPGYSSSEKSRQHLGNVGGVSRRGKFIRDCVDVFLFTRALDHGIDKAGPVRAEHPGDTHDQMSIFDREHVLFTGPFRFGINADRAWFILFRVRFALFAVEHVIGTDMDELGVFLATDFPQNTRRFSVDPKGLLPFRFAKIDIGEGGTVDQNIEVQREKFRFYLLEIPQVELRVIETSDLKFFSILALQGGSESSS